MKIPVFLIVVAFVHCDLVHAAPPVLSCDFDGSGMVDEFDLVQWQGDYALNGFSDSDADGDSDGRDFLCWQRHYGEGTLIAADRALLVDYELNADNSDDFVLISDWQANYGAGGSLAASVAVPEPGAAALLTLLSLLAAMASRGKK